MHELYVVVFLTFWSLGKEPRWTPGILVREDAASACSVAADSPGRNKVYRIRTDAKLKVTIELGSCSGGPFFLPSR